jgi:hypothetical protein
LRAEEREKFALGALPRGEGGSGIPRMNF